MFGHNDNDHEEKGQITLPPTEEIVPEEPTTAPAITDDTPPADDAGDQAAPVASSRKPGKSGAPTDDLLDIKQQALQALTPLVDHLDQSPEERFRTTMMMIQASDNHGLIKVAYEAAQQIADEKERAQALLDIVNEINYFTQHSQA